MLLVTKAKLIADAQAVQEILHVMRILKSINLKVKKLIILKSNNKGAIDLCNS